MTNRGEMHADLMRPSGFGTYPDERRCGYRVIEPMQHGRMTYRLARIARSHRHPLAFRRMASERPCNLLPVPRHASAHHRHIYLAYRPLLELTRKRSPCERRPRHDHYSRRLFVQPVDDPGTNDAIRFHHRGEVGKSGHESVDQRRMEMARCGMHRHAGGLIDHD